jgi:hypothetical protein
MSGYSYYGELMHEWEVGTSMIVINKDRTDLFDKLYNYLTRDCNLVVTMRDLTDGSIPIAISWEFKTRCNTFPCHVRIDLSKNNPKVEMTMNGCRTSYKGKEGDTTTLFRRVQAAIDYFHRGMQDGHFDVDSM